MSGVKKGACWLLRDRCVSAGNGLRVEGDLYSGSSVANQFAEYKMEQIWRTELFLLFESASYMLCPAMFRHLLRAEYCVDHRQSPAIALCMYVLRLFSSKERC